MKSILAALAEIEAHLAANQVWEGRVKLMGLMVRLQAEEARRRRLARAGQARRQLIEVIKKAR